jgi:serine/threonine protein kinase
VIGSTLKDYIVEREIGQGAFGIVYQGRHRKNTNETVAIKVLEMGGQAVQHMTEPEILAKLSHPNIVRLRDYFVDSGRLIIILDYISGGDLKQAIERGQRFDQEAIYELLRSMGSALAYAHERNIVHRDIKLANIMIDDSGDKTRFVLTDFGIGRVADGVQQRPNTGGTFMFMAPEQFRGRPVAQSDLWALGVVAYRLITGKMPFAGESLDQLSRAILYANPDIPSRAAETAVDEKLDLAVMQLLEKSLNERTSSAKELLRTLGETPRYHTQVITAIMNATSEDTGLVRFAKRLKRIRYFAVSGAVLLGFLIIIQLGFIRGSLLLTGLAMFYRSQNFEDAKSRFWLLGALAFFALAWFSATIGFDGRRTTKTKSVETGSDTRTVNVSNDSSGSFAVFSYPLFAICLAASRRIGRRLANCSLLIDNPKSNPDLIDKFRESVASRPNDILYRLKFVEAMLANGMLEDVAIECRLILEIDPYNFNANLLLANTLVELGLLDDAVAVCRNYLAVSGYCFEFQMLLDRCQRRGAIS